MALAYADRVYETSTTTGTGTFDLAGAASGGYQTFVAGIGTANTCYYCIVNSGSDEWEVGLGTVTDAAPDTLARTTVIASSNSDAAVNFSAGTKDVFCVNPAMTSSTVQETLAGDLEFEGTGRRITGDFSSSTHANRVMFQSSTTNGGTAVGAMPNGTSSVSQFIVYEGTDPTNCSRGQFVNDGTFITFQSTSSGTGTTQNMSFQFDGVEAFRMTTGGDFNIVAGNIDIQNGWISMDERAAPGNPGLGGGYIYHNSSDGLLYFRNDTTVYNLTSGGLSNIVEDTTPQLGGDLDANGNDINMGTAGRIIGDMSNGTHSNRLFFQDSTTNNNTALSMMPNGTATQSQFVCYNNSDPDNGALITSGIASSVAFMAIGTQGTGSQVPLELRMGATACITIDTSFDVTIGSSSEFILSSPTVPASASATGTTGQIAWDSSYIYVCTATNTWKRVAIATW